MMDIEEEFEPYAQSKSIFKFDGDQEKFLGWLQTDAPIEIEVGSGKGLFLRSAAKSCPDTRFIGLEIAAKYASMSAKKLSDLGFTNATCFAADAVRVIDEIVPAGTLQAVHVYFPDPWWKARHKKRRVLNPRMIQAIDRALKVNGEFHFWTDVLDYYESTIEMIAQLVKWDGPKIVEERDAANDMDYHTHFERRTRRNGMPVYRTIYIKRTEC